MEGRGRDDAFRRRPELPALRLCLRLLCTQHQQMQKQHIHSVSPLFLGMSVLGFRIRYLILDHVSSIYQLFLLNFGKNSLILDKRILPLVSGIQAMKRGHMEVLLSPNVMASPDKRSPEPHLYSHVRILILILRNIYLSLFSSISLKAH